MDETVSCSPCGTSAPAEAAWSWASQSGPRGLTWLCERCTRDNLRSIEGKLEEVWW